MSIISIILLGKWFNAAQTSLESTKSIFVQLRKDLKKQGKNLTLFIEDFTGFTGIDSELITVLSTEHGGEYADLCRVTAVIGLTDFYYDQFKGNFTDRVTHQISVTDLAYGNDDFLVQMTARYLNAIYCSPDDIHSWYESGAILDQLPVSDFRPPCKWDSAVVLGHDMTLYPFNKHSLVTLYEHLPEKSPRAFLKDVIRAQLKEYFDGKEYGDDWYFPINPANVQMAKTTHSSAIDRLEAFSEQDRKRLKAVFALWGDDGSASEMKQPDGTILFGGVNKAFFDDIGLHTFEGIGHTGGSGASRKDQKPPDGVPKPPVDGATQNFNKHREDITQWYDNNGVLQYDADYRTWLRTFIKGDSNQCGAINWQDIGIPAYIAESRLLELAGYYIEDQHSPFRSDRFIVSLQRTAESRDVLLALNWWNYTKGWEFSEATYFQQRLITWLEKNKPQIIKNVASIEADGNPPEVLKWCLALQYLKAHILGQRIDTTSPYTIIRSLFSNFKYDDRIERETSEWNSLIQFLQNKEAEFDNALEFLRKASATTMGAVHYAVDDKAKSCFRTEELVTATEELIASGWDIEASLPAEIPQKNLLYNPAPLLKTLYANIRKAMKADTDRCNEVMAKLSNHVGKLNYENLVTTLASIQNLFKAFASNSIIGSNDLRTKYEKAPAEKAKEIMKYIKALSAAASKPPVEQLSIYSANSLHYLADTLRDFQTIARRAEQERDKALKEIENGAGFEGLEGQSEIILDFLDTLMSKLEAMEVTDDVN